MELLVRRGEIYWVDLEPTEGFEANKVRPAVIVSNNAANQAVRLRGRGLVTILPISSNVANIFPFHVLLKAADCSLAADSKAQAEQVRTVDVKRIQGHIGVVPKATLDQIDAALRLHLAL